MQNGDKSRRHPLLAGKSRRTQVGDRATTLQVGSKSLQLQNLPCAQQQPRELQQLHQQISVRPFQLVWYKAEAQRKSQPLVQALLQQAASTTRFST
jgi:hypothetical protein